MEPSHKDGETAAAAAAVAAVAAADRGTSSSSGVVVQVREKKGPLRAAIPYMPFPVAVICLFLNTFVPGLGKTRRPRPLRPGHRRGRAAGEAPGRDPRTVTTGGMCCAGAPSALWQVAEAPGVGARREARRRAPDTPFTFSDSGAR